VAEHVAGRPASVEAVLTSLGQNGFWSPAEALDVLASTSAPATQAALLRLALSGPCERTSSSSLGPVIALVGAPEPTVSRLASLRLLRLYQRSYTGALEDAVAPAWKRSVEAIGARLEDAGDGEIVRDVALIGCAVAPLVPWIDARLARTPSASSD